MNIKILKYKLNNLLFSNYRRTYTVIKQLNKRGYRIVKPTTVPLMTTTLIHKFLFFNKIFDIIAKVEGDIVECGVGKGNTFLFFAFLMDLEKKDRNLWGFDSFEGFPEPTIEDDSPRKPKKGEWNYAKIKDIYEKLKEAAVNSDFINNKIFIKKGFFDKTLNLYDGNGIALLHIDADLYLSHKIVLNELFPKVTKGGVVIFDDYNEPNWPGATKAVKEFFKNTNYIPLQDNISKKYYLIR